MRNVEEAVRMDAKSIFTLSEDCSQEGEERRSSVTLRL